MQSGQINTIARPKAEHASLHTLHPGTGMQAQRHKSRASGISSLLGRADSSFSLEDKKFLRVPTTINFKIFIWLELSASGKNSLVRVFDRECMKQLITLKLGPQAQPCLENQSVPTEWR